jgi:carbon monoxide dehydrogenase subunit G
MIMNSNQQKDIPLNRIKVLAEETWSWKRHMQIENTFRVDLPVARAWATLLDIPSIVPCMPGAELLAVEDDRNYRGRVKVKLGPIAVAFAGRARLTEVDETAHSVRLNASGTEGQGRGSAQANVQFRLTPDAGGTRVDIVSDIALAGAVAQYGRAQGVIADVSEILVGAFAQNLQRKIAASEGDAETASAPARAENAPALSMFSLLLALVRRWFNRIKVGS